MTKQLDQLQRGDLLRAAAGLPGITDAAAQRLRHLADLLDRPDDLDRYTKFRLSLAESKYTRWTENLSESQLMGVMWLLGEFTARATLADYPIPEDTLPGGQLRELAGLRGLIKFRHNPMTVEEVRKYMREADREQAGRATKSRVRKKLEGVRAVLERTDDPVGAVRFARDALDKLLGDGSLEVLEKHNGSRS